MESMGLREFYKGKRVLVTGATGFKGSWLCYWLYKMGTNVSGIGLPPVTILSHYDLLDLDHKICCLKETLLNYTEIAKFIDNTKPEIVIHLAANAIVAKTFDDPKETFENNIMATVNLLEASRHCESVKSIVMITTDKVYENEEWNWPYRENDILGGLDPYSASKVCCEHVISCYRTQFMPYIATARAGNVIGGGDWAYARLIPDIAQAAAKGKVVEIHTPYATRPWQHVLEPLRGYLILGKKLYDYGAEFARPWNFGPQGEMTVMDILKVASETWDKVKYEVKPKETHPSMVQLLKIDSSEAKKKLGWHSLWTMNYSIHRAIRWYKEFYENGIVLTDIDIYDYEREMDYENM